MNLICYWVPVAVLLLRLHWLSPLTVSYAKKKKKNSGEQVKDNQHLQYSPLKKLCPKEVMPEYIQDLLFRDWICNGEKIVLGQHHFEL